RSGPYGGSCLPAVDPRPGSLRDASLRRMAATRKNAAVAARDPIVLGVDVGGTKVAAGQVVGSDARELVERPTELTSSQALVAEIEGVVSELVGRVGTPAAIGIGLPSQIDFATGRIVASVNIPLAGLALGPELE